MSVAEELNSRDGDPRRVKRFRLHTRPLENRGRLIDLLPRNQAVAWVKDDDGLIGWGELARLEVKGPDTFAQASRWWREQLAEITATDEVGMPGTGPVLFGSAAFDIRTGASVFVIPRVVLGRSAGRTWLTASPDERPALAIDDVAAPGAIRYADGAQTAAGWISSVAEGVARLRAGEVDKVVLARDLMATTTLPLDARHLLRRLADRWTDCWTYELDGLVGATPELLVRRTGFQVTSRVLAGTAARAGQGKDEAVGRDLLASAKNQDEHRYAIASLAEALAPFCSTLTVPAPHLLTLPTLMHLATDVSGELSGHPDLLDILAAVHPTAAVCGTPRDVAIDLIAELEDMDRGRYAGPVGWLDAAGNGEFGVALRCAQIEDRALRLFAGCGIMADSDPQAELAEAQVKLLAIRDALES
ncbi:MAG: isochorismate synthase [Actinomycetota bacterium]|nr:isochorismate synthase [Actinomycetota bacterium]